ncbi:hypothetical protein HELRODRAFT_178869 [Helobdella robusta]|uniref:Uncharacterized protein n=1 Tax=Helobdella robusta TaxID=6412 RepID=T1FDU4_HELRO|nr:hypothetical protein HELRODRAFT_178869 [Helobdella robusta]ESN95951.1 hypothetical protein HELRODRAFT_178869 [Helobdella robusta]
MQAPLSFLMTIFSFSIPRAVFQQQSRGGLAPVLEDNVGTRKHSTFCLCRIDDGRISALAVRLTLRSSDEILCADLNVVCYSVSGQIHSIDACQMMIGAMECKKKGDYSSILLSQPSASASNLQVENKLQKNSSVI